MKETPLSNCERRFLLRAIEERKVDAPGSFGLRERSVARPRADLALAGSGNPWGLLPVSRVLSPVGSSQARVGSKLKKVPLPIGGQDPASLQELSPGPAQSSWSLNIAEELNE